MAGRGPAPKHPNRRARRNAAPEPLRIVEAKPGKKPSLPKSVPWNTQTKQWWAMLDQHPLKDEFTDMDWSYLLDTAMLHNDFWHGNVKLAGELRLREAKYAFTPEDRARLRIQFAEADAAESHRDKAGEQQSARERYGSVTRLRAVND